MTKANILSIQIRPKTGRRERYPFWMQKKSAGLRFPLMHRCSACGHRRERMRLFFALSHGTEDATGRILPAA